MTCIVGLVHKNQIYMGGDSCGSNGQHWTTVENPKVFKVQDFIIGCSGSFRVIDLLSYKLSVDRNHPNDSDDKFMRTTFIDNIRECFKNNNFLEEKEEGLGWDFLVGYKNRLYEVQEDFSILNCPSWGSSVGSGGDSARGSLYTTRTEKNPKKRILMALEAAEAVIPTVRSPFTILDI